MIKFGNGSWVICRFSGTERLPRIAAEGTIQQQTHNHIQKWYDFLNS